MFLSGSRSVRVFESLWAALVPLPSGFRNIKSIIFLNMIAKYKMEQNEFTLYWRKLRNLKAWFFLLIFLMVKCALWLVICVTITLSNINLKLFFMFCFLPPLKIILFKIYWVWNFRIVSENSSLRGIQPLYTTQPRSGSEIKKN